MKEALKWQPIPRRHKSQPLDVFDATAQIQGAKGDKPRLSILIAGRAAAAMGIKPGDRVTILRSGENIALRKSADGFKTRQSTARDIGRIVLLIAIPRNWPDRQIKYKLAQSGDDFHYLEAAQS